MQLHKVDSTHSMHLLAYVLPIESTRHIIAIRQPTNRMQCVLTRVIPVISPSSLPIHFSVSVFVLWQVTSVNHLGISCHAPWVETAVPCSAHAITYTCTSYVTVSWLESGLSSPDLLKAPTSLCSIRGLS